MLQNHMLKVLALIEMEAPCRMDGKGARKSKYYQLYLGGHDHGQYEGYRSEEGLILSVLAPIMTVLYTS